MSRRLVLTLLLSTALAPLGHAGTITITGSVTDQDGAVAPYSVMATAASSYPDGSAGAPVDGNQQQPNFFKTYAPQNGQTYVTRPPWNVAGVDYPVGIPAANFPLKSFVTGSLPAGVSYDASSNTLTISGPNVTLSGWDFGINGGVYTEVSASATGNLAIINSNFLNGSRSSAQYFWIFVDAGCTANFSFLNNVVNGQAAQGLLQPYQVIGNQGTGNLTVQYCAFLDMNARALVFPNDGGTGVGGNTNIQFNYFEGQNYNSGLHGEWTSINGGGSVARCQSINISFNTFLQPANFGGGMTAPLWVSTGDAGSLVTIEALNVSNNTNVVNAFAFQGYIVGTMLVITQCDTQQLGSGDFLFGPNAANAGGVGQVAGGTRLGSQISGAPGGIGVWSVTVSQTYASVATPGTILFPASSAGFLEIAYDAVEKVTCVDNYVDMTGYGIGGSSQATGMYVNSTSGSPQTTESGNVNLCTGNAVT
jgi:hypothetical protein